MRGASALEDLLAKEPRLSVNAFVVWERVGRTPATPAATRPPAKSVLERTKDARAAQFWDPGQLLSAAVWKAAEANHGWPKDEMMVSPAGVIWDTVFVFPPGSKWDGTLPLPSYVGAPVVRVMDEVRTRL